MDLADAASRRAGSPDLQVPFPLPSIDEGRAKWGKGMQDLSDAGL